MDWTAFGIAALGIVGTLLSPIIAHWFEKTRQKVTNDREDQATLRRKLEEIFDEIDHLQAQAHMSSIAAMRIANGEKGVEQPKSFDLGHLRTNIALYFPELLKEFQDYDKNMAERAKDLRQDFKGDPVAGMVTYVMLASANFGMLATTLRGQLDTIATKIRMNS